MAFIIPIRRSTRWDSPSTSPISDCRADRPPARPAEKINIPLPESRAAKAAEFADKRTGNRRRPKAAAGFSLKRFRGRSAKLRVHEDLVNVQQDLHALAGLAMPSM
jgi:hypothetical protein